MGIALLPTTVYSLVDRVVGVASVTDAVSPTQQHLEGNVGDGLPHGVQALPGALVEEPQRHVKCCPAPVLQRVQVVELVRHKWRDLERDG